MVTARVGIYDGYAYPWGFGVSPESGETPDLTEPVRLVRELHDELGLDMVNLTMGNPYATTHVTRPLISANMSRMNTPLWVFPDDPWHR